ncbi:DNA-binding protein [Bosea sp. 62]|uniref:LytTR family DNA-binding domain-containing protein n=1 Tax=unclassified Bosea (in: a-proteobacteria) TaxID=2653178 RepID=UPI00125C9506|nr:MULTISPECIES: LytTR family DNA-binding domain-containing protein [unclassified Bosea (in: a-proteobacteria)]CAD5254092.1 DNA-binding protein [Bosea sp. 21B]CAD5286591.1 DNA-binding protein [Bosea sp. 7B]CAD5301299.1 DNA-binding protein [Bosea sp. 46]VVT57396.1 LytTr DNA-binding domain-containing protein [Bosea sp. EC-HK365B]VXB67841.1 DNA-binding protein [Bosea sp. 125]
MLRDENQRVGTSGDAAVTNGGSGRLPGWLPFLAIALGTAATCLVNAFSTSHDLARVGRAVPLWQPLLWEASSAVVILALALLVQRLVLISLTRTSRPWQLAALHAGAILAFSALHVGGMVLLRKLGYWVAGAGGYSFGFSGSNLFYELRKDVLVYLLLAAVFWLFELWRRRSQPQVAAAVPAGFWLRDGTINLRLEPKEIVAVVSAGNYVEYCLASGRRHLIRATLQGEEERLRPLGFSRIHRTRLVNTARIRRVAGKLSGDFDVETDTGESFAGSRRYRESLAALTP